MVLDIHQQELVNVVKAAHSTLAVARQTKSTEQARRIAELKLRLDREFEEESEKIRHDLDFALTQHEVNLDEALIAAYNNGIPIAVISAEGFGNRYAGTTQQLLNKLREDGRVGSSERGRRGETRKVAFPEPVDVDSVLKESLTPTERTWEALDERLEIAPAFEDRPAILVDSVRLTFDSRDPWFRSIPLPPHPDNVKYLHANTLVVFRNPGTGQIVSKDHREVSALFYEHPIARWVKDHQDEASAAFDAALGL